MQKFSVYFVYLNDRLVGHSDLRVSIKPLTMNGIGWRMMEREFGWGVDGVV